MNGGSIRGAAEGGVAEFTGAQSAAIAASGNVLVVAGAGTGKTRTLVERCVRLIREGADIQDLLLVTFTEAAGSEMRTRLRSELEKAALSEPEHGHLKSQLMLIDHAMIGTLHSFCLRLIREHFHTLHIDPQVVILEDRQTRPMLESALDETLHPLLADNSSLGRELRRWLGQAGGDGLERMREHLLALHAYSRSLPDPVDWRRREQARFSRDRPESWEQWVRDGLQEWVREWMPLLACFDHVPNVRACCETLSRQAGPGTDLPGWAVILQSVVHADQDLPWPRGTKTTVRRTLEEFFSDAGFLGASLGDVEAGVCSGLQLDWNRVRQDMLLILELLQRFSEEYQNAKHELGGVDFSDQEQLCLRLLWDADGRPTPVALECRERFHHVMVDEVQDINAAQDAILRAVSREGPPGNRFLVGDMKQSIYRFRLAAPRIFRDYEKRWRAAGSAGSVLSLSDNFRSSESILLSLNSIFARILRADLGGLDFDSDAMLRFGSGASRGSMGSGAGLAAPCVELRVLGRRASTAPASDATVEESEGSDRTTAEREAAWVASRLRAMREAGTPVWDDARRMFRRVEWNDMVILLRAPGSKTEAFARAFHEAGIPLAAARGGFFESQEILDLMSLVQVLDNPLQDIPLLAVLRSPLAGFAAHRLAEIRIRHRKVPLWTALAATADESAGHDPVASQAREFFIRFERWREAVRMMPISACLEWILSETHYEVLLAAGLRGEAQCANVRRFLDLARQFDPYQRQGLFRFQAFLRGQQDVEEGPGMAPDAGGDSVRLISVHRSKGLEFPVVVMADLGRPFNVREAGLSLLIDEEFGLSPKVFLPEGAGHYPTVVHWMAGKRARRDTLGEEIRLLYVGATRARDYLILVGSDSPGRWERDRGGGDTTEPAPAIATRNRARARSQLDWIRDWFGSLDGSQNTVAGTSPLLRWRIGEVAAEECGHFAPGPGVAADAAGRLGVARIMAQLRTLDWHYPHSGATQEPAKTTVSVLRKRQQERTEETRVARWVRHADASVRAGAADGAGAGVRTAAERGSGHHLFLQWVDLARTETELDLRNEAGRLQRAGVLGELDAADLDIPKLAAFWDSSVGRAIRKAGGRVHREIPFTLRVDAGQMARWMNPEAMPALQPEDFVVVQGQIDLAVLWPAEIWLLDHKSDRIQPSQLTSRVESYRPQLELYQLALEKTYSRPVTRRWIHFLHLMRTVDL